jgi:hypothetical protein
MEDRRLNYIISVMGQPSSMEIRQTQIRIAMRSGKDGRILLKCISGTGLKLFRIGTRGGVL